MKLFALTVDFAFKALFAPNPDLLMDLLNSFPAFQGSNKIKNLKVLNPEIPKDLSSEKLSILDIKAENEKGEHFLIEMQAFARPNFPKRILYYWSKVYSRSLGKGEKYENLKRVYSINFLKEPIWKDKKEYFSVFQILEKNKKFPLTEDLEIYIIELSKFVKEFDGLKSNFELWCYLLKESSNLGSNRMKVLERKNSSIKRAITELKTLSKTAKARELYESRRKAELDYVSGLSDAFKQGLNEGIQKGIEQGIQKGIEQGIQKGIEQGIQKGIEQGIQKGIEQGLQKGIEGFYLGIQLNLESRFNLKNSSIIKSIRKIKDIEQLKEILILSAKAKALHEIENKINKKFSKAKKK